MGRAGPKRCGARSKPTSYLQDAAFVSLPGNVMALHVEPARLRRSFFGATSGPTPQSAKLYGQGTRGRIATALHIRGYNDASPLPWP